MTDDSAMREFTRRLFTEGRADLDEHDQGAGDQGERDNRQSNHVPREGGGLEQRRSADYDVRNFAGDIFGVHPNQRNLYQGSGEIFRDWTRELFARAGIRSE